MVVTFHNETETNNNICDNIVAVVVTAMSSTTAVRCQYNVVRLMSITTILLHYHNLYAVYYSRLPAHIICTVVSNISQ